ncbi:MAG: hypothetical protein OXH59_02430 [Rhodospirillaceae bacterium]|nr:hypothetical protein [Rhodospirillaceae bacterium]
MSATFGTAASAWPGRDRGTVRPRGGQRAVARTAGLAAALCAAFLSGEAALAQQYNKDAENEFWETVKGCTDEGEVRLYLKKFPEGLHAAAARQCLARLQTRKKVEPKLKECAAHRAADRLTKGRGGNALDCYAAALKLDPGNKQALAGIAAIRKHYIDRAIAALDQERVSAAARAIGSLEEINPEDRQIEALRARLGELNERLAARKRLEELRRKVEALLAQGRPEQAGALLSQAAKQGLADKGMAALEKRVRDARKHKAERARARAAKVREVRALLERGDAAGARRALAEVRALGLDAQIDRDLRAAIERAERRAAALAAFREALARRDYAAARGALDRARGLGLREAVYRQHLAAIEARRADDLRLLVEPCAAHEAASRPAEALACYRKVLERRPDHAAARAKVRELVPRAAWAAVRAKNTAEAYHSFLQAHGGSAHAGAARQSLGKLEVAYWRSARKANTQAAYAQYLKIYPEGIYAEIAKKRLSERAN